MNWILLPVGVRVLCAGLCVTGFFLGIAAPRMDGQWLWGLLLLGLALLILSAAAGAMERRLECDEDDTYGA